MNTNFELILIEPPLIDFDEIGLIDILIQQEDNLSFSEATSYYVVEAGMAIGNFAGMTILIDPSCRLLNAMPAILGDLDVHRIVFCRIADPLVGSCVRKVYRDGVEVSQPGDGTMDNAQQAWDFIREHTGLNIDDSVPDKNLGKSKYALYVLE